MKVHWTNAALEHLLSIYEYVGQNSPVYADRIVDRLTSRSEQIGALPESGRRVPEYDRKDIREIIEKPYRIVYRIRKKQTDVLAVIIEHSNCRPYYRRALRHVIIHCY